LPPRRPRPSAGAAVWAGSAATAAGFGAAIVGTGASSSSLLARIVSTIAVTMPPIAIVDTTPMIMSESPARLFAGGGAGTTGGAVIGACEASTWGKGRGSVTGAAASRIIVGGIAGRDAPAIGAIGANGAEAAVGKPFGDAPSGTCATIIVPFGATPSRAWGTTTVPPAP
jgi:hypothetical protein